MNLQNGYAGQVVAVAAALLTFSAPVAAEVAAQLDLSCELQDATSGTPRSTFAPGEDIGFYYRLDVPAGVTDRQVAIELSARAKFAGIPISYRLDDVAVSLPNSDPGIGDAADPALPLTETRTGTEILSLPGRLRSGSVNLRAKVAVDQVGKSACDVTLVIDTPT